MLRRTALCALKATPPTQGGGDNPITQSARFAEPSNLTSTWMTEWDIRHEKNGEWGPTHYGGDQLPTLRQFLCNLNVAHPTIEPLFHPLLTHEQRMTRLYKRALREVLTYMRKAEMQLPLFSFYARQVRAEFDKHKDVDKGTAEWLFIRAVNYIENKKHKIFLGQEWAPGRTYWARYAHGPLPHDYTTFPHGFDPEEAHKLMNPYHKYGVPFMANLLQDVNPHTFMMSPVHTHNPSPYATMMNMLGYSICAAFGLTLLSCLLTGSFFPHASNDNIANHGVLHGQANVPPARLQ